MSSPLAGGSSTSPVQQPAAGLASNGAQAVAAPDLPTGAATVEADGELSAQRDAPIGGQAVLEGVMMRGVSHWAVAVRKPSAAQLQDDAYGPSQAAEGEVEVRTYPLTSALQRHRWLRVPIVRGVVALGGSLVVGFRALEISANAQLPEEEPRAQARTAVAGRTWRCSAVAASPRDRERSASESRRQRGRSPARRDW